MHISASEHEDSVIPEGGKNNQQNRLPEYLRTGQQKELTVFYHHNLRQPGGNQTPGDYSNEKNGKCCQTQPPEKTDQGIFPPQQEFVSGRPRCCHHGEKKHTASFLPGNCRRTDRASFTENRKINYAQKITGKTPGFRYPLLPGLYLTIFLCSVLPFSPVLLAIRN